MQKSCIVSFRICEEDKIKLQALASRSEKDLSNFILHIIREILNNNMDVQNEQR